MNWPAFVQPLAQFQLFSFACIRHSDVFLISGSNVVFINKLVSDGDWHHLLWTRRLKRITLTLDETFTVQADLPGAESVFNTAQGPVIYVDIGGFPTGVTKVTGIMIYMIAEEG